MLFVICVMYIYILIHKNVCMWYESRGRLLKAAGANQHIRGGRTRIMDNEADLNDLHEWKCQENYCNVKQYAKIIFKNKSLTKLNSCWLIAGRGLRTIFCLFGNRSLMWRKEQLFFQLLPWFSFLTFKPLLLVLLTFPCFGLTHFELEDWWSVTGWDGQQWRKQSPCPQHLLALFSIQTCSVTPHHKALLSSFPENSLNVHGFLVSAAAI